MAEKHATKTGFTPAPEKSESVTLPSGIVAAVRSGKGRDLKQAQRLVAKGSPDAATETAFALISILVTIDGQKIFPDQVEEMDLADVMKLTTFITRNFPKPEESPTEPASPPLSALDTTAVN